MPTATFREFIELLEKNGELARVKAKVSAKLEIAEICDRVCKTPAPHGHGEERASRESPIGAVPVY